MPRVRARWLTVSAAALLIAALPASAAQADSTSGAITGHLLDGTTAVARGQVEVMDATTFSFAGEATTDGSGAFTVTDLPPSSYIVEFDLPGGARQYAHEKATSVLADRIVVTAGATSTVEETVLPHGVLTGHVTTSAGAPLANAQVSASGSDGTNFVSAQTTAKGLYTMPYVPPGTYTLSFFDPQHGLSQAAHGKVNGEPGDPFTVTAGATTTVDEQFLPTGTISGQLTTDGAGVAFARVNAVSPLGGGGGTNTDFSGRYSLSLFPGTYQVSFQLPGGLTEWAHQKTTQATADTITVTAGADTVVDEATIPTGTLAGHLVDDTGAPVQFANVNAVNTDGTSFGSTDGNGDWQLPVFPGSYRVQFQAPTGSQWATGQPTRATASSFPVAAGQTTRVDEQLAPTGTVTATLRDTVTGQPVPSFCLFVAGLFNQVCTDTGSATLAALPGTYRVSASPTDNAYTTVDRSGVIVRSGQDTALVFDATPTATISTTVVDAGTGAPVAGICLRLALSNSPSSVGNALETCSDGTGAVHLTRVNPGTYNVFALAEDGVHGHQWVGPHGGVGAQKKAMAVTVGAGQSTTIAPVRMDKRGTLTGIIRDQATGAPIPGAGAAWATAPAGEGGSSAQTFADANGRYTFTDLGPYDWPIFYASPGYASEWSGNTPDRLKANPVTVKAGRTKTHNEALSRGVTLTGLVTGPGGTPVEAGNRVNLVNTDSRDEIGVADTDTDGRYTLQLLPRQNVTFRVNPFVDDVSLDIFYYVDSPDLDGATAIHIGRKPSTTVNIALPAQG